ncbi:MAG: hypothetical protein P8074_19840 [Anaerolineales bacterium]
MVYDENATPRIPPGISVSMIIWGQTIPATPVASTPQFVLHPTPAGLTTSTHDRLIQAGCHLDDSIFANCDADSPLTDFDCSSIVNPEWITFNPGQDLALVAACWKLYENMDKIPEDALYVVGCAFRQTVGYIFQNDKQYVLINTPEQMQERFAPIESASEALSYAQMMTGLHAYFDFSFDPSLLYFQESMDGTQVTVADAGYRMNLYHSQVCFCEPWVTSQVDIEVARTGQITWRDAKPVYMTTGFSCAD